MLLRKTRFQLAIFLLFISVLLLGLSRAQGSSQDNGTATGQYHIATFAGGCFWCVESDFDRVPGVIETLSGYMGGHVQNPGYKQVSAGGTGHAEVVRITYDPEQVSYEQLLYVFWHSIDPTVRDRQFCDKGSQYRSAIFYHNEEQKMIAERSRLDLEASKPFKADIVTEIVPSMPFYVAEDYHQNYHKKNPLRYKYYRYRCGRDQRLQALWGKAK